MRYPPLQRPLSIRIYRKVTYLLNSDDLSLPLFLFEMEGLNLLTC